LSRSNPRFSTVRLKHLASLHSVLVRYSRGCLIWISRTFFLTSRQVRERYGNVSAMWIWRRLNEPDSNFPKPTVIASRRFWRECDLIAWERSL
jgi:hypothetical protein